MCRDQKRGKENVSERERERNRERENQSNLERENYQKTTVKTTVDLEELVKRE